MDRYSLTGFDVALHSAEFSHRRRAESSSSEDEQEPGQGRGVLLNEGSGAAAGLRPANIRGRCSRPPARPVLARPWYSLVLMRSLHACGHEAWGKLDLQGVVEADGHEEGVPLVGVANCCRGEGWRRSLSLVSTVSYIPSL